MHDCRKYILQGFVMISIAICAGCMSSESNQVLSGFGTVLVDAAKPAVAPPFDLSKGANEFRVAQHRWPKDYPELLNFLKESDPESYRGLQAAGFSRIEFSDAPNGWLRVNAEYSFPPSVYTASGITVKSSGGTVTFDMTIGPEDLRETPKVEMRN